MENVISTSKIEIIDLEFKIHENRLKLLGPVLRTTYDLFIESDYRICRESSSVIGQRLLDITIYGGE